MTKFEQFVANATHYTAYGKKFDQSELAKQFIGPYNTGLRVRIKLSDGKVRTGIVTTSSGCKPVFVLLSRNNDGVTTVLGKDDTLMAVKFGRRYIDVVNVVPVIRPSYQELPKHTMCTQGCGTRIELTLELSALIVGTSGVICSRCSATA